MTTENLLFLSLQIFSSGIAGYITNKYAVNMIFKEYTPLKIGGAVKKNKEKFIEEISDLVERDIINSSTIKNNVLSSDFRTTMDDVTNDFITKSLYEVFEGIKIEDIVGIEETIKNTKEIINVDDSKIIHRFFDNILTHVNIQDILSEDQISNIGEYIYREINHFISENEDLKNLIYDLYKENESICLNQIISKETSDKLTRIISCEIVNSIDEILDDKKETKQLIDKVLTLIDTKSVMKELQKTFGSKTIQDIVGEDSIDKLSLIVYQKLDDLINSEEGDEKLDNFIEEAISCMEKIDLTIFEILPIHFGRKSSEQVVNILRNITPYFINWIEDNKSKIENIIDESIVESIDNIEDDLRKSMISKVKDTMLVDFAARNQIVDKINNFIYSYMNNDEVSTKAYEKIVKFLEETKISDIVKILEDNNLINKDNIKEIILNKWKESGVDISKNLIRKQSGKTLNSILGQDFYRLFNKIIKPNLYEVLNSKKDRIIYFLDKAIFDLVHSKINDILDNNINSLVKEDKVNYFSKMIPDKLCKYLKINSTNYKPKIKDKICKILKEVDLKKIIKDYEDELINMSKEEGINLIETSYDKYKSYEIKDIIKNISESEKFVKSVSNKVYEGIVNKLPQIIDGNVKKVIYDNLIKLDEEELCNIAQSFMGKQLKPLSMFGAFLGGMVGLIFGITLQNINGNYGFYNNIQNTLIACLILGVVGVMTNIIALWMIFCPYEKNKFIAKIPVLRIFSIGYIPSHKESFANGMAHFIDNELLSGSRLSNLFRYKRENLKYSIIENITDKKQNTFNNFTKINKKNLSNFIHKFILRIVNKNRLFISKYVVEKLLKFESENIVSYGIYKSTILDYISNLEQYEDKIVEVLEDKLKNNKSIEELLSQESINKIDNKINNQIQKMVNEKIRKEYVEELIKSYILNNYKIYNDFTNKTLNDVISDKIFVSVEKNLKNDKVMNLLLIQLKSVLNSSILCYIDNEFNEDARIDELFQGKLKNKINDSINDITEKSIYKISDYAISNQMMISNLVVKIIRSNLNFFVKMAYDFADGDGLVKDIIKNIINNKMQPFLIEEKDNISIVIYNILEREIYGTKISELGISSKEINISLLLDRFVYRLKQDENFKESIYNTTDIVIDSIKDINIKQITGSLDIPTVETLYNKCEDFTQILEENIIQNLENNEREIQEFIYNTVNEKIVSKLYKITLAEISWELNKKDVNYTVSNSLNILNQSEVLNKAMVNVIDDYYNLSIKNISLDKLLDKETLLKDLAIKQNDLIANKDFNENNKKLIFDVISLVIENQSNFIDSQSRQYITNKVIDAGLDTTERYIIPLLKTIDLKEITLKEVEHMHPKEIHMLFKAFAGDFFKKLYLYGSIGFIFGLNLYLSILLLAIDMIYTKRVENKSVSSMKNLFKHN